MYKNKLLSFDNGVYCLEQGGLIIYPTETFFAVGCALFSSQGLERLYVAKNRPKSMPIPVLAANMEQVQKVAKLCQAELRLIEQFWPGPLTLITKAKDIVPQIVSAGTGHIAIRISSHSLALALALTVDDVLVCSSANISGKPPVTNAEQLSMELVKQVDGIVLPENNTQKPEGLLASTLVEVVGENELVIKRHGAVSENCLIEQGWTLKSIS